MANTLRSSSVPSFSSLRLTVHPRFIRPATFESQRLTNDSHMVYPRHGDVQVGKPLAYSLFTKKNVHAATQSLGSELGFRHVHKRRVVRLHDHVPRYWSSSSHCRVLTWLESFTVENGVIAEFVVQLRVA